MKVETPLYELTESYRNALETLTDPELDIDAQTIADTLEGIQGTVEQKAIQVAAYFQNLEASVEAIEAAEKRMTARKKALRSKVESMKEYLRLNMEKCDIKKIECPEFSITLVQNPESVLVTDEDVIPEEFFDMKPVLSKTRVKDWIKANGPMDGAAIVRKNSIRIR